MKLKKSVFKNWLLKKHNYSNKQYAKLEKKSMINSKRV